MIRVMALMVIAIIAIHMAISSHYMAIVLSNSTSFIVWITPWGYYVDPVSIPFYLVVGVVIAYDCDYGINASFLREWFIYSIELIGKLRSMEREVFINLFCEKYIPTWIWRGYLSDVKIHREILNGLKNVIGSGNGTYIGFSELTTCVNDTKCRIKLVGIYKQLGREFPGSKLYYYGSGGDYVEAIQDLYWRAGLFLAGIDIWDLGYSNGGIYVKKYLYNKLVSLAYRIGWDRVIVGEMGLRVNDEQAYVEPWNKDRPIVYNRTITPIYYDQLLTDILVNKNARPAYIGIWSWNDGVYSIMNREDIIAILNKFSSQLYLQIYIANEYDNRNKLFSLSLVF